MITVLIPLRVYNEKANRVQLNVIAISNERLKHLLISYLQFKTRHFAFVCVILKEKQNDWQLLLLALREHLFYSFACFVSSIISNTLT